VYDIVWQQRNLSISKLIENNITSLVNTRHNRAISGVDRARVANVACVSVQGGRWAAMRVALTDSLLSNWTFSGRSYFASGTRLSITNTNGRPIRLRNAALDGRGRDRLGDRVDPVTKQLLHPYFDVTAFCIRERFSADVRAGASHPTNTPLFASPGTKPCKQGNVWGNHLGRSLGRPQHSAGVSCRLLIFF